MIDFEDGFLALQEEYDLEPVNSENFMDYKILGAQFMTDDEEILKQAIEITKFFDIYENSLSK